MELSVFEIEPMLSIRLYQGLFIFVILPDHDTLITKSLFVLMLDSEEYFLTINVVGRNCPHRNENDSIARFWSQDMPISCVCKRVAGTVLNSCNGLVNIWHLKRNYISIKLQMAIVR